ncbi:MAG: hypothetical protein LC122_12420 [Chitinophagales bacterium]|nr:hypothetical protein [Chitinophagales bacterium]
MYLILISYYTINDSILHKIESKCVDYVKIHSGCLLVKTKFSIKELMQEIEDSLKINSNKLFMVEVSKSQIDGILPKSGWQKIKNIIKD